MQVSLLLAFCARRRYPLFKVKAKNTEGNVYKVYWKKTPRGFSAWLSRVPDLHVKGKDGEELSEQLFEIAMNRFGDGEPCFDFDPPLPAATSEQSYFDPEWFVLQSNEHFRTVGKRADLYSEGLCDFCGSGIGNRTEKPRVLDWIPKSDFAFIWSEQPTAYIVTERFLEFFGNLLDNNVRSLPCTPGKASKTRFFELELSPEIGLQIHMDATQNFGITCPSCKRDCGGSFVCPTIGKGIYAAVERGKLTKMNAKIVVASAGMGRRICIDTSIAKKLKTTAKLKGVLLDRLVMLGPQQLGTFKLATADRCGRP